MELITPEGKFHLYIWAFLNQPSYSSLYTTNIHDISEREEYIQEVENLAIYTTDVAVEPTDRLVMLSTCVNATDESRFIAMCRMEPWEGQDVDMSYDSDVAETEEEIVEEEY